MAPRRYSAETRAIVQAIHEVGGAAKTVADTVAHELKEHTQHDDDRFDRLTTLVESIAQDTRSLLSSRSYVRGAWRAIVYISLATSTIVGLIIAYVRGH